MVTALVAKRRPALTGRHTEQTFAVSLSSHPRSRGHLSLILTPMNFAMHHFRVGNWAAPGHLHVHLELNTSERDMRRAAITETRLVNWLKDGRGHGVGKDYRSWIQVSKQDHSSFGQSHILFDPFINRQHHLLSNLERAHCVTNMAQPCIVDIRENYPLWTATHPNPMLEILDPTTAASHDRWIDSPGTVAIAQTLKFRHARYVGLKIPFIYSTDQVLTVTLPNRAPFLVAVSIKYWKDMRGDPNKEPSKEKRIRTRKKIFRILRLERAYWTSLGIPWLLATDRMVNQQVYRNLEWALSGAIQRFSESDVELLNKFLSAWKVGAWRGRCIEQVLAVGLALEIDFNTAVRLLKYGIMRGLIPVDLTRPVHLQLPFPHGETRSPMSIPSWSILNKLRRLP